MKLYYEIETARHIDRNGEEVIDTEAVECEVDDFDVVCAYMKGFHPAAKMAVISLWCNEDEESRERFLRAIMKVHGAEIEDALRQKALDGVFAPTTNEMGALGKCIEKSAKAPYRANGARV